MTRFMLYNVYRGGEGRMDVIAKIVRDANPNFLGILEAIGWGAEDGQILSHFSSEARLLFSHFVKSNTKYDLAFLSRQELLAVKEFREGFWHSVMLVELSVPTLGTIALVLLHLNPRREKDRFKELERVRAIITSYPHAILMGDFNSLSSHDPYDRAALLKTFKARGIEKFGKEQLEFSCIEKVESWGFVDVMQALKKPFVPTVPTPSNKDLMHVVPLRLDYVFISPSLLPFVADVAVLRTPLADAASDHYPLVVDFEFADNQ